MYTELIKSKFRYKLWIIALKNEKKCALIVIKMFKNWNVGTKAHHGRDLKPLKNILETDSLLVFPRYYDRRTVRITTELFYMRQRGSGEENRPHHYQVVLDEAERIWRGEPTAPLPSCSR